VINTDYRRYTVQFNSDSKVFDWLKFGNNLTFNHDVKNNGSYDIRNTMAALPTQAIFNNDGTYAGPVGQPSWYGDISNPIGRATINTNTTKGYNIVGNVYGEITLFKDLKFKTTGGIEALFWDSRSWAPKYNWQPIPQPNSSLSQQYNKSQTWLWDNFLTYEKDFTDHHLTLIAGSSAQTNRYEFINGSIQNFASDATQQLNNGATQPTVGGSGNEWALLSFVGRANYNFKGKYLVTATLRRDGSSRFGANNKWGTFPSGSVAWRISEEDFFKNKGSLINDLKLRVGYGVTGNQNIGNYSFASVLQTVQYNFNGQAVTAIVPLAIPNPDVRWEEVEQANVGVDVSLLQSRLNLTVDAYVKNTNDMLVPMSVPISTGYSDIVVPSINAGKVQNKGVELAITSRNLTGAVEWNTNFNISYNKNKVVSLNSDVPLYTGGIGLNQNLSIQNPGYPVNSFY
ncbi:MAG TPA: SusC/RagA family TonB-linked outer membrane protein, partial [Bacillota bacterium]|nr:SusC/RagA family TonB-linked outer membrane protein [Bacillota bacterium]